MYLLFTKWDCKHIWIPENRIFIWINIISSEYIQSESWTCFNCISLRSNEAVLSFFFFSRLLKIHETLLYSAISKNFIEINDFWNVHFHQGDKYFSYTKFDKHIPVGQLWRIISINTLEIQRVICFIFIRYEAFLSFSNRLLPTIWIYSIQKASVYYYGDFDSSTFCSIFYPNELLMLLVVIKSLLTCQHCLCTRVSNCQVLCVIYHIYHLNLYLGYHQQKNFEW